MTIVILQDLRQGPNVIRVALLNLKCVCVPLAVGSHLFPAVYTSITLSVVSQAQKRILTKHGIVETMYTYFTDITVGRSGQSSEPVG